VKILAILPYAPSLIRVRPYNLLRALARRHELTVLIVGTRPPASDLMSLWDITDQAYFVPTDRLGVAWSCARAVCLGEPLQSAVHRTPSARTVLTQILSENHFDAVHVEHLRAAFTEPWIPSDLPRVFDSVDSISLLWERTRQSSHSAVRRSIAALELQPTRRYETRLMSQFDEVAVTSPEDAAIFQTMAPTAPITVIPNGVDLEYFRPLDGPTEEKTLVFSGKMSYHANVTGILHFVQQIYPRVRAAVPDVRLRIAGSNPPTSVLALAKDPSIEVTGLLPDLRPAIGRATAAICPVIVKVGVQNKILEAMAMGIPVVASRQGAVGLEARPDEDLLVGNTPEEFARHTIAVLTDTSLRARLAANGRRYVERVHRWDAMASAFETLYLRAMDRHVLSASPV
jgi:glycosyltransferase involved in cell wall biosynthesis